MSDFINKPSRDELKKNLQVVQDMDDYITNGYSISIENGMVFVVKDKADKLEIGTLPNLAETTQYLFGDTIPEGVEYITIDGITMMTYYGTLIGCGRVDEGFEKHCYTMNGFINDDTISRAGNMVAGPIYGQVSTASASLEMLFRSRDKTLNYDNIIGQLANLRNFSGGTYGTGYLIHDYIEVLSFATGRKLTETALVEMEINGSVIIEFAREKDEDVKVEWAEGSGGEDSASVITMDDLVTEEFFEELEKAYPGMRDTLAECLSDADMETLDELFGYYGEASSARVNIDPLVFDMGNDGFDLKPLAEGTHFDMDGDGFAEKTNWSTKDGFPTLGVNDILGNNKLETKSGAGNKKIRLDVKCSSSVMENGTAA